MKDRDQLDGDLAALLIGWHREQESRVRHGNPNAFWGINKALTESLESL